jgi:hypothetical protein
MLEAIERWNNGFDTGCIKESFGIWAKRTIDVDSNQNCFVVDVDIVES